MTIDGGETVSVQTESRCAPWARARGLRPAGSAVRAPGGVLLLQWPLPWPRDIADVEELAPVLRVAKTLGVRVLLVARAQSPQGAQTICFHARPSRPDDSFVRYEPRELVRPRADVVSGALNLLAGAGGEVEPPGREVVVCTHGRRDVCCGGAGTALYAELHAAVPAGVRVWRSSHQGGHRFAPTALVLPDATSWSDLDAGTVHAILQRSVQVESIIGRYRGSTAIDERRAQVLEAVAFADKGWAWLDAARRTAVLSSGIAEVASASARWLGVVEAGPVRTAPACGGPPGASDEFAEWVLQAHRRDEA